MPTKLSSPAIYRTDRIRALKKKLRTENLVCFIYVADENNTESSIRYDSLPRSIRRPDRQR